MAKAKSKWAKHTRRHYLKGDSCISCGLKGKLTAIILGNEIGDERPIVVCDGCYTGIRPMLNRIEKEGEYKIIREEECSGVTWLDTEQPKVVK